MINALISRSRRNALHSRGEQATGQRGNTIGAIHFGAASRRQRDEIRLGRMKTNFTPRLPELAAPVLMVHGTKDIAVPVSCARRAAAAIPQCAYHEVEGGGHWLPREHPELAARLLTEWFG